MTREWKTRRITVIISTTKGKKDNIAFAATENANVCTSVRLKYLTVESTSPGDRRRIRKCGGGVVFNGGGEVEMGGVATRMLIVAEAFAIAAAAPITKVQGPVTMYFFIFVKVMGVLSNDLRSCFESFLIFLAKRFNTAYDLLLVTGQLVRW
jgi:hypothetical protein